MSDNTTTEEPISPATVPPAEPQPEPAADPVSPAEAPAAEIPAEAPAAAPEPVAAEPVAAEPVAADPAPAPAPEPEPTMPAPSIGATVTELAAEFAAHVAITGAERDLLHEFGAWAEAVLIPAPPPAPPEPEKPAGVLLPVGPGFYFSAPHTIGHRTAGVLVMNPGQRIRIAGSAFNDGDYTVRNSDRDGCTVTTEITDEPAGMTEPSLYFVES